MSNIIQAVHWLLQNETICLQNNIFVKESLSEKIYRRLSPAYDQKKIQQLIEFIHSNLLTSPQSEKKEYLTLSEAFIKRYHNHYGFEKIIRAFDRAIVPFRHDVSFSHPLNQSSFQKWIRYHMPAAIYTNHPEFCEFLETSGLLSQIKVTKFPPIELDGDAAILVRGSYMPWFEIKQKFEVIYSKHYNEKFLVHKETRDVYTFLDNGQGLQPHHPFLNELKPISLLTSKEYEATLKKAHCFIRSNEAGLSEKERMQRNKKRNFILQAVTSFVDGPDTRAHSFLIRAKHPYLRLIVGRDNSQANIRKGEVYEVGFGWKNKVTIPFITTQGQFRSPDLWEYVNCQEKVVTNIPITQEEAYALYLYTIKYHRDGINIGNQPAFHLGDQNCSTYTRMALAAAGISVPTVISLTELLQEIAPDWIRKVGSFFASTHQRAEYAIHSVVQLLPCKLQDPLDFIAEKITRVVTATLKSIAALFLVPIRTALGGGLGSGGEAFVPMGCPERRIEPSLFNWRSWFKLSGYSFNLPGVFQHWQRQQASTMVYSRPVKFTIVPE